MSETIADIASYRGEIDKIDRELVRLWNERAKAALAIGAIKAATGENVYVPGREGEVINNAVTSNEGPLSDGAVSELIGATVSVCRQIQIPDQIPD